MILGLEITKVTEQLLQAIANSDYDTYRYEIFQSTWLTIEFASILDLFVIQKWPVLNLKQLEILWKVLISINFTLRQVCESLFIAFLLVLCIICWTEPHVVKQFHP